MSPASSNWPLAVRGWIDKQRELATNTSSGGIGGEASGRNHVVVLSQVSDGLRQLYGSGAYDPESEPDPLMELGIRLFQLRGLPVNGPQDRYAPSPKARRVIHSLGSSNGTVEWRDAVVRIVAAELEDLAKEVTGARTKVHEATINADVSKAKADEQHARADELAAQLAESDQSLAEAKRLQAEQHEMIDHLRGRVDAVAGTFPTPEQLETVAKRSPRRLSLGDGVYLEVRAGVPTYLLRQSDDGEGGQFAAWKSPAAGVTIEQAAKARERWLSGKRIQKETVNV